MSHYQIIIADDHPLYLASLATAVSQYISDVYVHTTPDYLCLFDLLAQYAEELDLLVLDLTMPGSSGLGGLFFIRKQFPDLPLVIISAHDDMATRQRCLAAGASAFLSKTCSADQVIAVVRQMLAGEYQYPQRQPKQPSDSWLRLASLTQSQYKVFYLLAEGCSNKQIAARLNIAEKTVKVHVSAILQKLQVENRTQAARLLADDMLLRHTPTV